MTDAARGEADREVRIEMTPMIDVTFLLLIFFLCSIKFRVLEGKLQTYLPKDRGVKADSRSMPFEDVDLRIVRLETGSERDLTRADALRGWQWDESQVALYLQQRRVPGLRQLGRELARLRAALPASEETVDPLTVKIIAESGVIYEDVIRVVDTVLANDIADIVFRGIELDS